MHQQNDSAQMEGQIPYGNQCSENEPVKKKRLIVNINQGEIESWHAGNITWVVITRNPVPPIDEKIDIGNKSRLYLDVITYRYPNPDASLVNFCK